MWEIKKESGLWEDQYVDCHRSLDCPRPWEQPIRILEIPDINK